MVTHSSITLAHQQMGALSMLDQRLSSTRRNSKISIKDQSSPTTLRMHLDSEIVPTRLKNFLLSFANELLKLFIKLKIL